MGKWDETSFFYSLAGILIICICICKGRNGTGGWEFFGAPGVFGGRITREKSCCVKSSLLFLPFLEFLPRLQRHTACLLAFELTLADDEILGVCCVCVLGCGGLKGIEGGCLGLVYINGVWVWVRVY